jgi:pilus assembly protein FimV
MGDAEGTRSILDEVIADGNDEQKQEAEELLNQLAS